MLPLVHEPDTSLELDISLPPSQLAQRFDIHAAAVRSVLFSPAWGRAERFVGRWDEQRLHLRVRHWYSNGFARLLSGEIAPTATGSQLKLRFRSLLAIELLVRAALRPAHDLAQTFSVAHHDVES